MKKITFFLVGLFFLTSFFSTVINNCLKAEVIDIEKEEKKFGDWNVYCDTDVMMDNSHCKIAARFFDGRSAITIEPIANSFNQLLIVIPQIKIGSFVKLRVDKNDLILSGIIRSSNFGLITLGRKPKRIIYNQIKNGDFLFFRFNVKDSEKEVTIKINLKTFRKALKYYNSRVSR